jgi:hypothetical protein
MQGLLAPQSSINNRTLCIGQMVTSQISLGDVLHHRHRVDRLQAITGRHQGPAILRVAKTVNMVKSCAAVNCSQRVTKDARQLGLTFHR